MLQEQDSRVLSAVLDSLIKDFEPTEAVSYMAAKEILTDDQRDAILSMRLRRKRVEEFVRQYRRSAQNLNALVSFFQQNGQIHLADELSTPLPPEQRPLLSDQQRHSRLLRESNVPGRIRHYIRRDQVVDNLRHVLADLANTDEFWLVVHGMAGCGKSTLVADILYSCPEILSRHYEHVIWMHDGRSSRDSLPAMYADFYVLVSNPLYIDTHQPVAHIQSQVRSALLDKPNALIVLDDVVLEESVRWFDQLQCRILATSRNLEIFQAASCDVFHFPVEPSGFTIPELSSFVSESGVRDVPDEVIKRMHRLSSGLPAMVNIIVHMARDNAERLEWLCGQLESAPLGSLKCVTSYRYSSMEAAIQSSVNMLSESQRDVLSSLVVFPVDEWLPVEAISLIAPVDVTDHEESIYATQDQLETLAKYALLDERQAPKHCRSQFEYRIHPLLGSFLRRTLVKDPSFVQEMRGLLMSRLRSGIAENRDERVRIRLVAFNERFLLQESCKQSVYSDDMAMGDHRRNPVNPMTTITSTITSTDKVVRGKRWSDDCFMM